MSSLLTRGTWTRRGSTPSCVMHAPRCRSTPRSPSTRSRTRLRCGAVPRSPTSPIASLLAEAARLDELRLEAQEERIGALLAVGATARAIAELEPLLAQHPLRERLWEQLMLAQYRDGRQAEALARLPARAGDPRRRAGHRSVARARSPAGPDPGARSAPLSCGASRFADIGCWRSSATARDGVRFRAIQPRIGRDVTVEVVREDVAAGETFVARFEPEAQAVAALEHPHIVAGLRLLARAWPGLHRDALPSRPLARIRSGPGRGVDRERGLAIVDQLASALAFAHRQGVAHGDIGSANVVFDAEGNAYLGGFEIGAGPPPSRGRRRPAIGVARACRPAPRRSRRTDGRDRRGERRRPGIGGRVRRRASSASRGTVRIAAPHGAGRPRAESVPGLRAFTEADAPDFFGRDAAVDPVVERLREPGRGSVSLRWSARAVAASPRSCARVSCPRSAAAGSTVEAGLRRRAAPRARTRCDELEAALGRIAVRGVPRLGDLLRGGSRGLLEAVDRAIPGEADVVLVVDQFEELFTLTTDEAERTDFLDSIRVACVDPDSRVR